MASMMRVSGLASGIDYESMIKQLMDAHRIPLIKLEQERQILEWRQEDYREINNKMRTFRDTVFHMKLQGTYLTKSTSVSHDNILSATANSSAVTGSYDIVVKQLAKGVSKGSQSALAPITGEGKLAEQFGYTGIIKFNLKGSKNEEEFEFDMSTATIYDVVRRINEANLGIKASYDSIQNRFFLSTESTGADQYIDVVSDEIDSEDMDIDGKSFLSDVLGLDLVVGGEYKGQDSIIDFGDIEGLKSSTNSITVNGITINLNEISPEDGLGEYIPTTITVTNDIDAVVKTITDFIDQYNSLVETLADKIYEKRYADYLPLTDEQREKLTDDQIDQWIKKAKSGLLRNDTIVSSILTNVRMAMSSIVSDVSGGYIENGETIYTDRLSKIGIKTTVDYMSAKLEINKDQLRAAIEKDPEGVMSLFTKTSATDDYDEMGIAGRLYQKMNYGMDQIFDKAGSASDYNLVDDSFIGEEIKDIDDRLENWEDRLQQIEDRYYRQFTAMEQAIAQLNQQSAWLMQQFGGNS